MFVVHFGRRTRNRLVRVYTSSRRHGVWGDENRTVDTEKERQSGEGEREWKTSFVVRFIIIFASLLAVAVGDGVPVTGNDERGGGVEKVARRR